MCPLQFSYVFAIFIRVCNVNISSYCSYIDVCNSHSCLQYSYVFAILIIGSPYDADWNQQRREWKQSNCYSNENSSSLNIAKLQVCLNLVCVICLNLQIIQFLYRKFVCLVLQQSYDTNCILQICIFLHRSNCTNYLLQNYLLINYREVHFSGFITGWFCSSSILSLLSVGTPCNLVRMKAIVENISSNTQIGQEWSRQLIISMRTSFTFCTVTVRGSPWCGLVIHQVQMRFPMRSQTATGMKWLVTIPKNQGVMMVMLKKRSGRGEKLGISCVVAAKKIRLVLYKKYTAKIVQVVKLHSGYGKQ